MATQSTEPDINDLLVEDRPVSGDDVTVEDGSLPTDDETVEDGLLPTDEETTGQLPEFFERRLAADIRIATTGMNDSRKKAQVARIMRAGYLRSYLERVATLG